MRSERIIADQLRFFATPTGIASHVRTSDGLGIVRPDLRLRFSSFLMVRDAVLSGAGIALVPKLFVADDLAAGRLVCWGTADGPEVETGRCRTHAACRVRGYGRFSRC